LAWAKKWGWTYARTAALRDHQIQLEPDSDEVRPLFKAPREDCSWFRAELDCSAVQQSNLNKK
jgi:hypothetical protein